MSRVYDLPYFEGSRMHKSEVPTDRGPVVLHISGGKALCSVDLQMGLVQTVFQRGDFL